MAVRSNGAISSGLSAFLKIGGKHTRLGNLFKTPWLAWFSVVCPLIAANASAGQPAVSPTNAKLPVFKSVPSAPPFSTEAERCIIPASTFHGVNPWLLRAILRVESSLKPGAFNRNSNGTIDIGIGQINSMHLPTLKKYGIDSTHLSDACIGTYVSGWFLKKVIVERGNTWEGVASYHSRTPEFNQRYQRLLIEELQRSQASTSYPAAMPTPMPAQGGQPVLRYGLVPNPKAHQPIIATRPADEAKGMMIFEQGQ